MRLMTCCHLDSRNLKITFTVKDTKAALNMRPTLIRGEIELLRETMAAITSQKPKNQHRKMTILLILGIRPSESYLNPRGILSTSFLLHKKMARPVAIPNIRIVAIIPMTK